MVMILDDWQRIEKIVRWTGLSVNSFALNIGLNRGENLYQIKRGNNGISRELAELISSKYPEISKAWILAGEGGMFVGNSEKRNLVPVYNFDAVCLAGMEKLPPAAGAVSLPNAGHASFAALMLNRAMEPEIPNGAVLVLEEAKQAEIIPGYPYLVVCDRVSAVRNVSVESGGETLRLVAANPAFGDMTVEAYEVKRLCLVKAHIHYNL